MRQRIYVAVLGVAVLAVAGCAGTTEAERIIIGAGAGAAAAKVAGGNDGKVILGAIGGGAAGALCNDVGVCRDRTPYYTQPQGNYTRPVIVGGRTVYVP